LRPPEGSQPGDQIFFDGYERKPVELMAKKNPTWDLVAPQLVCDDQGLGAYKENGGKCIPFKTSKGVCKSDTIKDGVVK
jgi:glutamyl-tRNA synthetase